MWRSKPALPANGISYSVITSMLEEAGCGVNLPDILADVCPQEACLLSTCVMLVVRVAS